MIVYVYMKKMYFLPPYSTKKVRRIAICFDSLKDKLLEKHTLLAVMSLPIDLFKGIGVITCFMIFKAHIPL